MYSDSRLRSAEHARGLLLVQTLVLFGGAIFAWSKLLPQFGDLPRALATACFYGSTAFLAALYWSCCVYQRPALASERRLRNFLLFCVVFAASVVAYEAIVYYKLFGIGTTVFICTPGVSPLQTPCFYGLLFFIAAFALSVGVTRRLKSSSETIAPGL